MWLPCYEVMFSGAVSLSVKENLYVVTRSYSLVSDMYPCLLRKTCV